MEDHSYYVQQLSYLVWATTEKKVTREIIMAAIETLLAQNALLYTRDTEELSNAQHNFLKALASGIHKGLSSQDVVRQYRLGTSANVQKIKKALLQKELIDDNGGGIYFLDPVYQLWFQKNILQREIGVE